MDINNFNDILTVWREGKLSSFSIGDLRVMSTRCVVFIQNRYSDAVHAKDAIDAEIRRKEATETEQRAASLDREKIEAIRNLDGKVATIDGRLTTLERVASRPEFRTWGFWLAFFAIIISIAALLRDYWRWSSAALVPASSPQSVSPAPLSGSPTPAPVQSAATNRSDVSTSQPTQLPPQP